MQLKFLHKANFNERRKEQLIQRRTFSRMLSTLKSKGQFLEDMEKLDKGLDEKY